MKDKFNMTVDENIMYAKRNIVDLIYKSSRLEGIAVTFPDIQQIYDGRSVAGLSVEDIIKVNNLKHAWQFIFDTIDYTPDLRYIRQINSEIGQGIVFNAGVLRESDVSIGGTSWKSEIPDYDTSKAAIDAIISQTDKSTTDKAIELMLYVMRSQMFFDGNKRTAQLVANQYMIQNGAGIIGIPVECQGTFFDKLIHYYETNQMDDIKKFLYETSIDGYTAAREKSPVQRRKNGEITVYECPQITNQIKDDIMGNEQVLFLTSIGQACFIGGKEICQALEREYGGVAEYVSNRWEWGSDHIANLDELECFTASLARELEH